jgi:hypothetical protein
MYILTYRGRERDGGREGGREEGRRRKQMIEQDESVKDERIWVKEL